MQPSAEIMAGSWCKRNQGMSLIEVLVALVILSVGLLGTAALQIQSKRANLGSVERTLASMLVNDMFERMRSNPGMYDVYRTELDIGKEVGKAGDGEPAPNCASSACTPRQLALHDVWEWEQSLLGASEQTSGLNPVNTGGVVLPLACMTGPAGGASGLYTIAINWRGHAEITSDSTPDPCNISGLGTGRYDGDTGADTLRRVIEVSSYLHAE